MDVNTFKSMLAVGETVAAILLLGKDDVILNVCPAYETDALVRRVNVDRYDDREIVRTNLVESFEQLMDFARKHLPDKFFLEDENRVSLRNIIAREMVSNILMHREYTSSYAAKFVIQKEQMYTENANRAIGEGYITPDNLEPNPKNPIIASFFRNIGRADRLGSGVRNLFKYSRYYSGQDPEFQEGDIFRIIVPLNEEYSFDQGASEETTGKTTAKTTGKTTGKLPENYRKTTGKLPEKEEKIIAILQKNPRITQPELAKQVGLSVDGVRYVIKKLKASGILSRIGSKRSGSWQIHMSK